MSIVENTGELATVKNSRIPILFIQIGLMIPVGRVNFHVSVCFVKPVSLRVIQNRRKNVKHLKYYTIYK